VTGEHVANAIRATWAISAKHWRSDYGPVFYAPAAVTFRATWRPVDPEEVPAKEDLTVAFRAETGRLGGVRWGRVIGAWRGVSVVVTEGPLPARRRANSGTDTTDNGQHRPALNE
jgi:hypothetical protein